MDKLIFECASGASSTDKTQDMNAVAERDCWIRVYVAVVQQDGDEEDAAACADRAVRLLRQRCL